MRRPGDGQAPGLPGTGGGPGREPRPLQASKCEHKAPAFLAVNPRGKVPALKDGDIVIRESLAIVAYLDRRYPDPPLFGRDAKEAARGWQQVCEIASYL